MATIESSPTVDTRAPYIEWAPVIAGSIAASALSFLLLTFGGAIGLTLTSPWPGTGARLWVVAFILLWWMVAVQIGSFAAGGYLAGRMRSRWGTTTTPESQFRDSVHGFMVWALGVLIGALALGMLGAGAAKTGVQSASMVAGGPRLRPLRRKRPPLTTRSTCCCVLLPAESQRKLHREMTRSFVGKQTASLRRRSLTELFPSETTIISRRLLLPGRACPRMRRSSGCSLPPRKPRILRSRLANRRIRRANRPSSPALWQRLLFLSACSRPSPQQPQAAATAMKIKSHYFPVIVSGKLRRNSCPFYSGFSEFRFH